jgi:hypothetical protein
MLNQQPVDGMALQAIEKLLDDLESQVGNMEVELTLLQDAEVQRRSQAIASHDDKRAVSWSSSSILVNHASTLMYDGARDNMSMLPLTTATHTGGTPAGRIETDDEAQNSNKYIDCMSVPTDHRC